MILEPLGLLALGYRDITMHEAQYKWPPWATIFSKGFRRGHIIYATGSLMLKGPYFNWIALHSRNPLHGSFPK